MNLKRKHAIGLLAALLVLAFVSVALVVSPDLKFLALALTAFSVLAGVTVTYEYPVTGATAPTTEDVNDPPLNIVSATVNMSDSETTATVTHNFGNPGYGPTDTSRGWPIPIVYYASAGTGPVVVAMAVNSTTLVLTKASSAGSGGTFQVNILRPSTNSR